MPHIGTKVWDHCIQILFFFHPSHKRLCGKVMPEHIRCTRTATGDVTAHHPACFEDAFKPLLSVDRTCDRLKEIRSFRIDSFCNPVVLTAQLHNIKTNGQTSVLIVLSFGNINSVIALIEIYTP